MFLCILPVSTSIYLPFRNTEGTAKRVETHKEGQRSLAKAGRTIYPTMGFLKARHYRSIVLLASVTSCKLRLERDDVVIISPCTVIITFAS